MSLFWAELRKVWGNRLFPLLLAVLAAAAFDGVRRVLCRRNVAAGLMRAE